MSRLPTIPRAGLYLFKHEVNTTPLATLKNVIIETRRQPPNVIGFLLEKNKQLEELMEKRQNRMELVDTESGKMYVLSLPTIIYKDTLSQQIKITAYSISSA